jgi:hypothetical protein
LGAVSEGQIRAWGTLFSDATDTGILKGGRVVLVDAVPSRPAETQAQQIAERDAQGAQARLPQRLRNQQRKEVQRRAQGSLTFTPEDEGKPAFDHDIGN